jgi:hypothetical protein
MPIPESRHVHDDLYPLPPRRQRNRDWYRLWASVLLAAFIIGMVWLIGSDTGGQPMPCERTEVYVWENYPNDAACVDADNHEEHT